MKEQAKSLIAFTAECKWCGGTYPVSLTIADDGAISIHSITVRFTCQCGVGYELDVEVSDNERD